MSQSRTAGDTGKVYGVPAYLICKCEAMTCSQGPVSGHVTVTITVTVTVRELEAGRVPRSNGQSAHLRAPIVRLSYAMTSATVQVPLSSKWTCDANSATSTSAHMTQVKRRDVRPYVHDMDTGGPPFL